jgi:broad specificity phosphatase PhoE
LARATPEREGWLVSGVERRLYLIRHGKANRRSSGETVTTRGVVADPPLDETGREQATILAARLRKMPEPAALYCSTLARARQTIAPFVEATGAQVTYSEDLVEWYGGEWEFKEFEELLIEHAEMPRRILLQDPVFHLAPGGEPFDVFQRRVVAAIEAGLSAHPNGDVWVVCHGGVINAYLASFLELHEQDMFFLPPNTSINTVKVRDDERTLWFLADDTHVTAPELFAD